MRLPEQVKTIFQIINGNKHEAYVVGGCVRDSLMGVPPKDWDVATSMHPEQVVEIFKSIGYTVVPTGIKHGTVTIVIPMEDNNVYEHFEVTTFRHDGNYSDGRRPDEVTYAKTIEEDLSRRDFTFNAIAYNPEKGYVDPFGGVTDIKLGLIKTVGNPKDRFQEDALRILRAIRFYTKFDKFSFDFPTLFGLYESAHLLKNISMERKRDELFKIITESTSKVNTGVSLLSFTGCMNEIISEWDISFSCTLNDFEHLYPDTYLRLAYLLSAFDDTELTSKILNDIKCDNTMKRSVKDILKLSKLNLIEDKISVKSILSKHTLESYLNALEIQYVKGISTKEEDAKAGSILAEILLKEEPYKMSQLAINGNDLVLEGFVGSEIGEALNKCLNYVIANPEMNKKQKLITYIKRRK